MSKFKKIKSKLQRQSEKLDQAVKYSFVFLTLTLSIVIIVLSIKLLTA